MMTYESMAKSYGMEMDSTTVILRCRRLHSFRKGVLVIRSFDAPGSHILSYERSRSVTKLAPELVRDPFDFLLQRPMFFGDTISSSRWGMRHFALAYCIMVYQASQTKQQRLNLLFTVSYILYA
jgi:hypothetical protein